MKEEQCSQYDHSIGARNRTRPLSVPLRLQSAWSSEEEGSMCEADVRCLFTSGCGCNIRDVGGCVAS